MLTCPIAMILCYSWIDMLSLLDDVEDVDEDGEEDDDEDDTAAETLADFQNGEIGYTVQVLKVFDGKYYYKTSF